MVALYHPSLPLYQPGIDKIPGWPHPEVAGLSCSSACLSATLAFLTPGLSDLSLFCSNLHISWNFV